MAGDSTPGELEERYKAYFRLTPQDLEVVAGFREMADREIDEFLDSFYDHLLSFPENRRFFPDADTRARARAGQREYFLSLFNGIWDEDTLRSRQNFGRVHDRILTEPWQLSGMFAFYVAEFMRRLQSASTGRSQADPQQVIESWMKLVLLDLGSMWQAYHESRQDKVREMEAVQRFASQRVNEVLETRQSLEEQAKRLDALVELGRVNFDEPGPEAAARRVLLKILDVMVVEAGEVWVVDREGDGVLMVTQYGPFPKEFREITTFKLGEGIPGLVAATGQPIVTQELAEDTRFLRRAVVR
jgi:hypothetical protein